MPAHRRRMLLLVAGDLIAILALSLIGFYFHNRDIKLALAGDFLAGLRRLGISCSVDRSVSNRARGSPPAGLACRRWRVSWLLHWPPSCAGSGSMPPFRPFSCWSSALTTAAGMGLWRLAWGCILPTDSQLWMKSALVQNARKGDLDAFNRLVLAYQDMAFNLAARMLSDPDIAAGCHPDRLPLGLSQPGFLPRRVRSRPG